MKKNLVASILLMGGGFANATEKTTCPVREDSCRFCETEPVVSGSVELSSMCFLTQFDLHARSSVRDKSLNQIREKWKQNHSNVALADIITV
jgi:hypothetical protein